MAKVVRTRVELEGRMTDELALVQGRDLPGWTGERTVVGVPTTRIDGVQRVTRRARYTQDLAPPGLLHARFVRSPHAHARVRRVDPTRALRLRGVRAVLHLRNAPKAAFRGEETIFREEVRFAGEEVAVVCAESEEVAAEALRLINVEYEPLPHVVDLEDAVGAGGGTTAGATTSGAHEHVSESGRRLRGDAARALREAEVVVDATYRTATQLHNTIAAALLAKQLGAPVRCVYTREEENLAAGNRSATLQRLRIGWRGGRAGRISGLEHTSWSSAGQGRWVADPRGPTNTLYAIDDLATASYRVVTNAGSLASFRAPGYVEATGSSRSVSCMSSRPAMIGASTRSFPARSSRRCGHPPPRWSGEACT